MRALFLPRTDCKQLSQPKDFTITKATGVVRVIFCSSCLVVGNFEHVSQDARGPVCWTFHNRSDLVQQEVTRTVGLARTYIKSIWIIYTSLPKTNHICRHQVAISSERIN